MCYGGLFVLPTARTTYGETLRNGKERGKSPEPSTLFSNALPLFKHVLDRRLIDHQIRRAAAVQLDAALVVPLDVAVDLLAIAQYHHHGSLGLHLLLIIEIFGVGLLGRGNFLAGSGRALAGLSAFGGSVVRRVIRT